MPVPATFSNYIVSNFANPIANALGGGSAAPAWVLSGASVDMNFASALYFGGSLSSLISNSNSTGGYVTNADGTLTNIAANLPRIGVGAGLLVEETRTNIVLQSQALGTAPWAGVVAGAGTPTVVTNNFATAPDGTATATRLQFNPVGGTGSDFSGVTQTTAVTNATAYNDTFYVKSTDGISTGNIILQAVDNTNNVVPVTGAWTRVSVNKTSIATSASYIIGVLGNTSSVILDVVVWGAQREPGAFATSYIPTTTVAVTRSADVISPLAALLSIWSAAAGSILNALGILPSVAPAAQLAARNGNVETFQRITSATTFSSRFANTSLAAATFGSGSLLTTSSKLATGWDAGGVSNVGNNGAVASTATTFVGGAALPQIGGASGFIDGYLQRLTAWAVRLPDTTLKAFTV